MIYWIQEATQAGAQGAASAWPSAILGGVVGAIVILVGVVVGQYLTQRRHSQTLEQTAKLEDQRAREAALQNYFEQMGKLLDDKDRPLRRSTPGDDSSTVAQAQTLAVLEGLDDSVGKRISVQFLYKSALIYVRRNIVSLEGANLYKADLSRTNLSGVDLSGADLSGADLRDADLSEADLSGTNLRDANLRDANLSEGKYLIQEQIDEAEGDETTLLPDYLQRPAYWGKGASEEN